MYQAQRLNKEIKRQVRKGLSIFVPWEPPLMVKDLSPITNQGIII